MPALRKASVETASATEYIGRDWPSASRSWVADASTEFLFGRVVFETYGADPVLAVLLRDYPRQYVRVTQQGHGDTTVQCTLTGSGMGSKVASADSF